MHQVAVRDSEDVLERGDVALGLDVERELLAGTDDAVAEQIAVVLGRTAFVADDGQLLVDHNAQTGEQGDLRAGQADAAGTPDAAGSVGGVGDVGVGQHAGGLQPCSHVGVDGDGVDAVGALTQQVLRSSDGGGGQGVADAYGAGADRDVTGVSLVQRCAVSRNQTPHLGDQLLVHLAGHVLSQLAADVGQCVLTCLVGVEVVGSEHRTTGGDGAVLRGSLGLLAGVVAGLVQAPGVGRIDALFDVVQRSEERQLNTGADRVVQACVSSQNAGGVESRLLEDLFCR